MKARQSRIRQPDELAYFKGLIVGPHGAGKTRFLGTANLDERTSPMLFIASEAGTQTLVGLKPKMDVHPGNTWQDFNDAFEILDSEDHGGYRSVGIDSISEVQIEGMLNILDKGGKRADPDTFAQADWGVILVQMRRFVRLFKNLEMHVFFTALAKEEVRPRVGRIMVPLLQGSFVHELPGIVDTVAYLAQEDLDDGDVERVMLLRDHPEFSVKARAPWDVTPPSEIVDPTVSKLLDALGFAK